MLSRTLKYATLLTAVAFAACVLLQIFARLALPTAPSWTEEAARVCFVLAVGSAAGLALRNGDYVGFDFFYRRLGPTGRRRLDLLTDVVTVALFAVFTVAALRFVAVGLDERSPSLRFPMALPFASMLLLGGSVLAFALVGFRQNLRRDAQVGSGATGFSDSGTDTPPRR